MALTNDLISQFVKITKDDTKTKGETTVYGTLVEHDGSQYVQIDGSDLLTPISQTASAKPGERVTVMIKNHTAIVTGNTSSPSARSGDLTDIYDEFDVFEVLIASKVDAEELQVERGRIDTLITENTTIKNRLTASEANVTNLQTNYVTVTNTLNANSANIENLQAHKLDVTVANATYATITELEASNARIYNLESTYGDFVELSTERLTAVEAVIDSLDASYANLDFSNIGQAAMEYFYSKSGLIEDVSVGDATISGKLVGVTISGDLIEGNTVKADKLVIKGSDGLYYKLNTDGMTTEAQQTDQNSLNGSVIKAKSITASKVNVTDLVAFGATIGGFHISNSSLYSGSKSSVDNTTRGIYLDKDGQVSLGDTSNYIKYYKDTNNVWRLAIAAGSILFGIGDEKKDLSDYIKLGSYLDPDTGLSGPSIELSDGDSDFKQITTSTKTVFMDGSVERTKIDKYGVSSTNVVAENQLTVGGFLWSRRSNGNLGLMWKGGIN